MGKYRILLVIFSFFIIYLDVYVNKQTTSYFVSSTIFYAMLLYDYEKLGKSVEDKFKRIVSTIGSYSYSILLFINVFFMMCALFKQVNFIKSHGFIFNQDLKIFHLPSFGIGLPFCVLFVLIFAITFLEVFSERGTKSVPRAETA